MDFIADNLSTIVVGALVFGILALVLFKLIRNFLRGKSACPWAVPGHPAAPLGGTQRA
jgi:hypothetical protein